MSKYCFGVDIGGTTVKIGLFSVDGTIVDKWEIVTHTENKGETILLDIAASLQEKIAQRGILMTDIKGIGVGVPAPVSEDGIVNGTANLGWEYKEVKKELEKLMNLTVVVGNDANVAALGEMWQGGGKGYKNLVMVTLGTGVGGGIILDGKILGGSHGAGGEIGHIHVQDGEEDICGCGNHGCLEQYASATGIVRLAKKLVRESELDSPLRKKEISAKDVFDQVKAGDALAIQVAEEFGRYLGMALSIISTVVDPQAYVIGGGVSKAGDILFTYIKKYYQKYAFFANREVGFTLATLGNDAGMIGAAKLALDY